MAGLVECSGVAIRFKARGAWTEALAPTELRLAPGSFTALIGPSGCGKSTLLNAIAGFVQPAAGGVAVDGAQVTGPSPEVGVVFQQYALFPWFTARGNVEFALRRLGMNRAERRAEADAALAEVGLHGRGDAFPAQLSGGMKQRVALARTLAARPKVLFVTHDVDEALTLADRIHVMASGPGRIIETIELGDRATRDGPQYMDHRRRIIALLRHREE